MEPTTLPAEIKATLETLSGNLARVNDLEGQIKALQEQQKGTAEVKAEVAKLSEANAKLVDDVQAKMTARFDEIDIEMQKRMEGGGAAFKSAGELFTEAEAVQATKSGDTVDIGAVKSLSGVVVDRAAFKAVTLSANATPPQYVGEIIRPQDVTLSMRSLIPAIRTSNNAVNFIQITTRPTAAAPVAPGATKPEGSMVLADLNRALRKIAEYVLVNDEQLSDFNQLRALIDNELRYDIQRVEDSQFLTGDNTGQNLDGIIPNATAYAAVTYGSTVQAAQRLDHVRGMMAQLQVAGHGPTGIVVNPLTWFQMETTKDGQNGYVFARPQEDTTPRLWGLPVVATTQIAADNALVGDFIRGAQIFDGQMMGQYGILLKIGYPNDTFLKNQTAILAEERVALAVKRPGAFVYGDVTPA